MDNIRVLYNNLESITTVVDWLKIFFISICTYYTFFRIIANKKFINKVLPIAIICILMISIISMLAKYYLNFSMYIACLCILIGWISSISTNISIGYAILITIISMSFNYIIFVITLILVFIFNLFIHAISNDLVNLLFMMILQIIFLYRIFKIKKFKYGLTFLKNRLTDGYIDLIILNISVGILFSIIIFSNIDLVISRSLFINFIIFTIIMVVSIQKSLQLYYKQKLLIKELEATKLNLTNKEKEISKLEQENLNFSKKSHSLAHKQRALEYKLNKLMLKSETAEELDIKDRLENLSKELYQNTATTELTKTEIPEIDDMLEFMQSECKANNIDFNLQINGNIFYMINNLISKEELEILIADHIKDAIIAIKHTDNINKSILVRLGKIDEDYGLYIYDSGIEFEKETLENLGKKPSTTHPDEGGTGIGFMNTFDTLRKHKASLIIKEIGAPSKDNYTKVIIIKFDNKNEFKIISYKQK